MKLKGLTTMILACALLVTGCASKAGKTEDTSKGGDTASSVSYPITIKHAYGETVIKEEPKNVVAISWGNPDTPLALGVVPAGISKANYGKITEKGLLPWTDKKFTDLGVDKPVVFDDVDGLDYEAISNANPNVILAAYSGLTQEEYDMLSKIAPVVAYPKLAWQTYWRDQITTNATAMGKKDEGTKLVSELDKLIADKVAEYPSIKGKKVAFCYFSPTDLSKFYIYTSTDPRAAFLNDLGLVEADSVKELAKSSDSFALTISSENIDKLADVEVIVAYGNAELLKQLQADKLLGTLPAIKNGSVALIDETSDLAAAATPSALSIPATIDEYLKLIGEAADKVK